MQLTAIRKRTTLVLVVLAVTSWCVIQNACAELITLHHFRLGEDEGGIAGSPGGDPTVDSVGSADLARVGAPKYAASEVPGSGVSMEFENVYGAFNSPMHAKDRYHEPFEIEVTDPLNWGMEAWVFLDDVPGPDDDSEVVFVHVGSFVAGGSITLQIGGGNYWIHAPGLLLADSLVSAEDDVGRWIHLAMVNDDGLMRLLRDGEELVTVETGEMDPAEGLTVGAMFLNGVAGAEFARGIDGRIDEVRIFEFEPGEFDLDDTFLEGVPGAAVLQAGDADQDWDFDQLDLVQVQIAGKYLTGQTATWGEGDWDGAPGGEPGNPPQGDGLFNQLDIIAALNANIYLEGPYAGPLAAVGGPLGADLASIPEPSSVVLLGLGALTLASSLVGRMFRDKKRSNRE